MKDVPIYVTCRDRVRALRPLVDWLERAGHERITLINNASTFVPLLDYLAESPHTVLHLEQNYGCRALFKLGLTPDEPFVLTDPDIVPIDECPLDAVQHFAHLLARYPSYTKCGFGLYTEDVPSHMPCLGRERQMMASRIEPGVYDSGIDTTFALYKPGTPFTPRALRTGLPYMARHVCPSWYGGPFDEEDHFYTTRATKDADGSTWARTTVLG